jgi:hypothetical protein
MFTADLFDASHAEMTLEEMHAFMKASAQKLWPDIKTMEAFHCHLYLMFKSGFPDVGFIGDIEEVGPLVREMEPLLSQVHLIGYMHGTASTPEEARTFEAGGNLEFSGKDVEMLSVVSCGPGGQFLMVVFHINEKGELEERVGAKPISKSPFFTVVS